MTRRLSAALSSLLVVGSACAGGDGPTVVSSPGRAPTRAELTDILLGGLDVLARTDDVIATCMAERGFATVERDDPAPGPGMADATYVEEYGYGIAATPPDGGEIDAAPDELPDDPAERAAYLLALTGNAEGLAPVSADSCLGREQAEVARLTELVGGDVVQLALTEFSAAVESAREVVDAQASWRACMRDRGYDVATRDEIIDGLIARLATAGDDADLAELRRDELAVASADLECSEPVARAIANVTPSIVEELVDRYAAS